MVYIDLNMWRAGGVDDSKDWKYRSYNVYAYGIQDEVTDLLPFYLEISEDKRQEWYRSIVADRKHTIQREHIYVEKYKRKNKNANINANIDANINTNINENINANMSM